MRPRNNILAFITALVVLVQSFPLKIGRGSYVYDPNSIPQNERILRLFLHLASHTANRLIHLKKEAKLQKVSTLDGGAILPAVCKEIHDNHPSQEFHGREQHGRCVRPKYAYGQAPSRVRFDGSSEEPFDPHPQSNWTNPQPLDKVVVGHDNGSEIPKIPHNPRHYPSSTPGRSDSEGDAVNVTKSNDNTALNDSATSAGLSHELHNSNVSSMESQDEWKKSLRHNETEDSDNVPIEIASRALFNLEKNNYVTHYNDNSRNVNNADTTINNVALPNGQGMGIPQSAPVVINQNVGSSRYQEHNGGDNINQANTRVNNIGSGLSGSVVVTRNAGFTLSTQNVQNSDVLTKNFESSLSRAQSKISESIEKAKSVSSNLPPGSSGFESTVHVMTSGISDIGGSEIARQAMNATSSLRSLASGIQSAQDAGAVISRHAQNIASSHHSASSEIVNSADAVATIMTENAGAGISAQSQTAASNLRSVASEITNSAHGLASKAQNADAEISAKVQTATSNLHSMSSAIMNAANGVASNAQSAGAEISTQAHSGTSKVHSVSSEIMNSAHDVASKAGSANTIAEKSREALTEASQVESGVTEHMSAIQQAGSKVLLGTTATTNRNQTNRAMTENQDHGNSETHGLFGMLNENKLGGIVSNANGVTSALLKEGTALTNSSQEVSSVTNVGSGSMKQVMRAAQNTDSSVVRGFEKPLTSIAHGTTENVGNLLGGLGGVGSKFTGSVVMETGSGSKTAFETSFRRGSASSSLMTSTGNGVSQVGSSLIGSIPLFRSFPDLYEESSVVKKSSFDTTPSKDNRTEVIDGQTSLTESSADNQGLSTIEDKTLAVSNTAKQSNITSKKGESSVFYDEYANNEEVSELELEEYTNRFADALRPVESIGGRSR